MSISVTKNLIFLLLFFVTILSAATETHPFVKQVRTAIKRIKPFKVAFVAQVVNDQEIEIEESGIIIFKDKDHLKWTYMNPDFKVFLLEGKKYQFYEKDNEQLTIGNVNNNKQHWIWQLIFAPDYNRHITCDIKQKKILIQDPDEDLNVVIFLNDQMLPQKVVQKDPSGLTLVHLFKDYQIRVELKRDDLQLKVPKGIDIVRLQ